MASLRRRPRPACPHQADPRAALLRNWNRLARDREVTGPSNDSSDLPDEAPAPLSAFEKLTKDHDVSAFDCGKASLNDWLRRFALTNQQIESARTYAVHRA